MDNILCNDVGRCCLCPEHGSDRRVRQLACFDLQIFVDEIQGVHLLAFVLMQTFDLDVENGVRVRSNALGVFR